MASVTLGSTPALMSLPLVSASDYVCTLVSQNGTWPTTATISIEVADATWTATIDGAEARFNVDQEQVDAVIAQNPSSFRLWYVDGDARLLWGRGSVNIYRD